MPRFAFVVLSVLSMLALADRPAPGTAGTTYICLLDD
jgi:hypothetical protein